MVKRKNNPNTRCKVCGRRVCVRGKSRLCDDPLCTQVAERMAEAKRAASKSRRPIPTSLAARPFWGTSGERRTTLDPERPAKLAPPVLYGLLTKADVAELKRRRAKLRKHLARAA